MTLTTFVTWIMVAVVTGIVVKHGDHGACPLRSP